MLIKAVVIFVDIRGFTMWSSDTDVHQHVVDFVNEFEDLLQEHFEGFFRKVLGDGALLIKELAGTPDLMELVGETMDTIESANQSFLKHCDRFYTQHGVKTDLHLGWGITRSDVWQNHRADGEDYLGKNINEASRLCSHARPYGVIIDSDDFRDLPERYVGEFTKNAIDLAGFDTEVHVWVTEAIANRIKPPEMFREDPLVYVNGLCVRWEFGHLEVLVMKRSYNREFCPGLLEVSTGGQLAKDETFVDGVSRLVTKELDLEVEVDRELFSIYQFGNREKEVIPGVRHICWYEAGVPSLRHYDEFSWMTLEKFQRVPDSEFIPGVKKEVARLLRRAEANPPPEIAQEQEG